MDRFAACFDGLDDPRDDNARHNLLEILIIAFATFLCGGEGCRDMQLFGLAKEPLLRQFLRLKHGIPSHDTFSRVFRLLDPVQFEACFRRFMEQFARASSGVIAIDGKTLRRSFDRAASRSPLHLVSAWAVESGLMLGQVATAEKSNEITAVPELLAMLCLKGMIVTADAMNCQRGTATRIIEGGGDFVLALKSNQPAMHRDVKLFLEDPARSGDDTDVEVDKTGGRIETRAATVSTDIGWLQDRHAWPGLAAIGKIHRTREIRGEITAHTAYYLLSTPLSAIRFNRAVREHWRIENSLHWVLDVAMNEDRARNRKGHGPENLALLRRLALNAHRIEGSKGSVKGKLKRAGWDDNYLLRVLRQPIQQPIS